MNNNYFSRKNDLSTKATKHYLEMEERFKTEIEECAKSSDIFKDIIFDEDDEYDFDRTFSTKFYVTSETSTQAITRLINEGDHYGKVGVLNFASFKNPGGAFLQGSSAQEEWLCHDSTLYNVLSRLTEEFYKPNLKYLNNGYYDNSMIHSKDVLFHMGNNVYKPCDVITSAAPNIGSIKRFKPDKYSPDIERKCLKSRIDVILFNAMVHEDYTLVLGAFGCGVFGNNPMIVSTIFKELLLSKYKNAFEKIVFAIPGGRNLEVFEKVFSDII